MPFTQKGDPILEKLIAVQNSHYEKLNQLENLLTLIVKSIDDKKTLENERSQELATVMANELGSSAKL